MFKERIKKSIPLFFIIIIFLILIPVTAFLSFEAGYKEGFNYYSLEKFSFLSGKENQIEKTENLDFDYFWQAWALLDENFVDTKSDGEKKDLSSEDKLWGAIKGLASSYGDPYTNFLPPEENETFEEDINGSFGGIGVEISNRNGYLTVISPLVGTPAFKAGMRPRDIISTIDGKKSAEFSSTQAAKLIRGEEGTEVVLGILRSGESKEIEIKIIRDIIKIPTIETEIIDDVFIIKLFTFNIDSNELFTEAMFEFKDSGKKNLLIDLRGNPGGLLSSAVYIASFFIEKGEVVVLEDYDGKREDRESVSYGLATLSENIKIAILQDEGSASASEILAGSLSAHNRALILGRNSFGKGSVQRLVDLSKDTSLKITVARWLLPNGESIPEDGISPDIEIGDIELYEDLENDNDFEKIKDGELKDALEIFSREDFKELLEKK